MSLVLAWLACSPAPSADLTPMAELDALDDDLIHPERILIADLGPVEPGLAGQHLTSWRELPGTSVLLLPAGVHPLDAVEELRAQGYEAEPDLLRTTLAKDPLLDLQWHLSLINTEEAWEESTGSGVTVAVLDTGVAVGGNDTPNVVSGWDFVDDDGWAGDANGHGTHVAGTIAQATNNGVGGAGVAPDATILAVRVLDAQGRGWTSDIIAGVELAVDEGADIINLSLGSYTHSQNENRAMKLAKQAGVLLVGAAGNDGLYGLVYPARYNHVMAVGAVDARGLWVSYSNYHWKVEICAPGGDTTKDRDADGYVDGVLQQTKVDGEYGHFFFQGTSMATPHVAGVAALVMSMGVNSWDTRTLLKSTATDTGKTGKDVLYGWGLVDAEAAVLAVE